MTDQSEDQPSAPARRGIVVTPFAMFTFLWSMMKPFLIVMVVAVGLLSLLRLAGIGG